MLYCNVKCIPKSIKTLIGGRGGKCIYDHENVRNDLKYSECLNNFAIACGLSLSSLTFFHNNNIIMKEGTSTCISMQDTIYSGFYLHLVMVS